MNARPACPAALLQQALDAYRQPLRFRKLWADPRYVSPEGFEDLLDLALAPTKTLAAHAARLHVNVEELSAAIHFVIRQVLLKEGDDAYRMLGLTPAATPGQIKSRYRKLMRLYHPDRNADSEWSEIYAPKINRVYASLRRSDGCLASLSIRPSDPPCVAPKPCLGWQAARRYLSAGFKPQPAGIRPWSLGFAVSCTAVAAGLGFIAWNFSAWSEPPGRMPARPEAPPVSVPFDQPTGTPPASGLDRRPPPLRPAAPPGAALAPPGLGGRTLQIRALDHRAAVCRQGDREGFIALFSDHMPSNRKISQDGILCEYTHFKTAGRYYDDSLA